jgi:glucosamine 6-phosphate synthetase-like amidotransferase/phosphosugar isomerase protein
VAVVQNGIIENDRPLREELQAEGVVFRSETDTEVIPHLLSRELGRLVVAGGKPSGALLLQAVYAVLPRLHGAYVLAVVWAELPVALVVARKAAPLLIGLGEGEFLCASDTAALAGFTRTILPMEDGEVALLTPHGIELYDAAGDRVQRTSSHLRGTEHVADKRSFPHLMLKEISYIHAEGYPAGEMKHGPIALLDARVPVVSIAVPGTVFDKVLSNAQEAKARDAQLIGERRSAQMRNCSTHCCRCPRWTSCSARC